MLRFLIRLTVFAGLALIVAMALFRFMASNREVLTAQDLITPESRFVETIHGTIHVIEAGPQDGTAILLIHGSVGWAGLWADTVDDLAARGYRVMAIDLPPMGLSDRDLTTDYSRQAQGLRILAFVEAAGVQPILVAHSFGAGAAAEALMADEGAFKGAVIIAGALALGKDEDDGSFPAPLQPMFIREAAVASTVTNPMATKWLFQQFLHRKDAITDRHVDLLETPFARIGTTQTIARWLPTLMVPPRGAASSDPVNYANLTLPVAMIWGREDTVTPPEQANALAAAFNRNVPLIWLSDVGHIPNIEAPDAFHQALDTALTSIKVTP